MCSLAKQGGELVRNNYLSIFFALPQPAQNTLMDGQAGPALCRWYRKKSHGANLLFAQQVSRIDMQCPSHRSGYRKCSGEHHGKCNRGKHKWVLGGGLVDDG